MLVSVRLEETGCKLSRLVMKPNVLTDPNDQYRVAKRADADQAEETSR